MPRTAAATIRAAQQLLPAETVFLAGVRDPVARAYSHYRSLLARGVGCRRALKAPCFTTAFGGGGNGSATARVGTFREAVCYAMETLGGDAYLDKLAAESPSYPFRQVLPSVQYPHWDVLSPGFYGDMLRPWTSALGAERFFVYQAESLAAAPAETLAAALAFLRLPPLAADALSNATLYARSANSFDVIESYAHEPLRVSTLEEDPDLVSFLTALYANSSRTTNELFGTQLAELPYEHEALAGWKALCRSPAPPPPSQAQQA
jgi:hypothetical protein